MRYVVCALVAQCLSGCASAPQQAPATSAQAPPARPPVMPSLSQEEIDAVVKANRGEIKRCYEQELLKNPKLAGMIKIRFTISGRGSVVSALVAESSMQNAAVEQCIVERVRSWVFPEPKGGGIVIVNYPFNFSS